MVKLIFIRLPDGERYEIDADCGQSLMEAAVNSGIPRIIGECGGACSCGTCHIYIDKAWREKLPPAAIMEEDMLAFIDKVKPVSRLACQISLSEEMDGMAVYLP